MASSSVAASSAARSAASAASSAVTVPQPSSPFASLLRRSRFATFDPKIRQTYSTPPSHASRGSWGLKRPLALRRRNSFITLPAPFEDRAQFIEWNKAEDEVRFIRRFEEMQVRPVARTKTPWAKTLGSKNSNNWIIDSEFCRRYEGPEAEESNLLAIEAQKAKQARAEMQQRAVSNDLAEFGKAGPGNYGHRRALIKQTVRLSPNIEAMMPDQFERYVRRLRQLRPKFKEFLQQVALEDTRISRETQEDISKKEKAAAREGKQKIAAVQRHYNFESIQKTLISPTESLFEIAQAPSTEYHRRFIESHTASQFADITNPTGVMIEQRPHQVGGLLYSHPTPLHTQLFGSPQPGILLQNAMERKTQGTQGDTTFFIGSFGGFTPVIRQEDRGDKIPLLNHHSPKGIERENIRRSVAKMRMVPGSVVLESPPLSVGRASNGLKSTRIASSAVVVGSQVMFSNSNPYKIGSMEYVALQPPTSKNDLFAGMKSRSDIDPLSSKIALNKSSWTIAWKKTLPQADPADSNSNNSQATNKSNNSNSASGPKLIATLQGLVRANEEE
ncbi:hypothetical protein EV361DRAFT_843690 [Lentinula raphanica]|nr:hypothetical protein EV361DRAFT_843690 [Lentinula raphanica]